MSLAFALVLLVGGRTYAEKLRDAGVATELIEYPGAVHELFGMAVVVDIAAEAQRDAAASALRDALANGAGTQSPR